MRLKITVASISTLLLFAPFFASAQSTDFTAQIAALRAQVLQLQARLEALKAAAAPMPSAPSAQARECELGMRHLILGMSGEDVRCLQRYLAANPSIYPERLITGYFGALTQRALERYQAKVGIVSAGSATTTGYGALGPQTRLALKGRRVTAVETGVPSPSGFFVGICPADARACPDGSTVERTGPACEFAACPGL